MSAMALASKTFYNFLKSTTQYRNAVRSLSAKSVSLSYSDYGDPIKVITPVQENITSIGDEEVLIKMVAAPVNPADINTVQGKYPDKPALPAIAGNEGVGEIVQSGKGVKDLMPGDRVIPGRTGLGTWRTFAVFSQTDLIKIPKNVGVPEAATFTVNPCTAYRMIKDFKELSPNDTVIQNGANSACGQNVIQICKALGINTVNIVRNRPEFEDLKMYLMQLGATYVLTEEEIRTTDIFKTKQISRPRLALNCVGGKSALEIMRQLDHSGVMVTYGGMSRDPVTIPTSALIFKNVTACGFWMTQWTKDNASSERRKEMYNELFDMIIAGKLKAPAHQFIKFKDYKDALMNTLSIQGFAGKKFILDFEE